MDGNIEITNSNSYFFTDSLAGDMVIYTSSQSQHMLLGTKSNVTSVVNLAQNLLTINRLSYNNCNAIFLSNVGVSTAQPKASLHTMRDVFIDSNDMPWPTDHGRGIYMRFFSSNSVDAGYIQSVERDGASTQFQDMYLVASNLYLSTGWSSNTEAARVTVKPSGRVGINTSSPGDILDVNGNIFTRSNVILQSNQAVVYGSNVGIGLAGRIGYSVFGSNSLDIVGAATALQTGRYVTFYVNSNQAGGQAGRALFNGGNVLLNTGFIGIGVSNPLGPLHLAQQNTPSNNVIIEGGKSSDNTNEGLSAINFNGYFSTVDQRINTAKNRWRIYVDQRSSSDHLSIDSYNGTQYTYATLSNMNIGINKSNPVARLHLVGNTQAAGADGTQSSNNPLTLEDTSGSAVRVVHINTHPTDSTVYNYQTNKSVYWGEASDTGSYFFRGRSVAIGSSNPDKSFTVGSGSTDTTSAIKINTGESDKLYITHLINGSKISHSSGWSFNLHAGQSNSYGGMFTFQTGSNAGYLERMRIDQAGNVGINVASPQATLHVVGNASTRPALFNGASMTGTNPAFLTITGRTNQSTGIELTDSVLTNNAWKLHRSNTQLLLFQHATGATPLSLSSNNVVIVSSNLGVNTSAPESLVHVQTGPSSALQVGTQTTSFGATMGTLSIRGNNTVASRQWNLSVGAPNSSTSSYDTQRLRFLDSSTERMTLDTSGFLGIGKNNPSTMLHVQGANGNVAILETTNANGSSYLQFKSAVGSTCYIGTDGSGYGGFSTGAMMVSTWSSHPLILATNQTERMRIAASGVVTVNNNMYPASDNTVSLGISGNRWSALHAASISTASLSSTGGVSAASMSTSSMYVGGNMTMAGNTTFQLGSANIFDTGAASRVTTNQNGTITCYILDQMSHLGNGVIFTKAGNSSDYMVKIHTTDSYCGLNAMNGAQNSARDLFINNVFAGSTYFGGGIAPQSDNARYCGFNGNRWIAVYAVNGAIQTSDSMTKDFKPLDYGLQDLEKVTTVKYKWKDNSNLPEDEKDHEYYGVLADELDSIFPELVYNQSRPYQLNYSELIPVCVNAIKQLSAKVKALEERIGA